MTGSNDKIAVRIDRCVNAEVNETNIGSGKTHRLGKIDLQIVDHSPLLRPGRWAWPFRQVGGVDIFAADHD